METRLCSGAPIRPEFKFTSQYGTVHLTAADAVPGCGTQLVERKYLGENGVRGTVLLCPRCDAPDSTPIWEPVEEDAA